MGEGGKQGRREGGKEGRREGGTVGDKEDCVYEGGIYGGTELK